MFLWHGTNRTRPDDAQSSSTLVWRRQRFPHDMQEQFRLLSTRDQQHHERKVDLPSKCEPSQSEQNIDSADNDDPHSVIFWTSLSLSIIMIFLFMPLMCAPRLSPKPTDPSLLAMHILGQAKRRKIHTSVGQKPKLPWKFVSQVN